MNTNERFEIDFLSLELTEGEKTQLISEIAKERGLEFFEPDTLTKENILEGIKNLSVEDQNEVMVTATKDILVNRAVKMKYLSGVASDANDQSNQLLLSARVLQEGLKAGASTVG